MQTDQKHIFISYGHDEYIEFINRIAQELKTRGIYAWIDSYDIKPSTTWYDEIKKAIDNSEIVMAFLTEHSMKRDGFCVNELLYALQKKKKILPLKIEDVEIPIFMLRIQWLDIRQLFNEYKQCSDDQFEHLINQIVDDINEIEPLPLTNEFDPLFQTLKPIDNVNPLMLHQTEIIGREWLFDLYHRWFHEQSSKILMIYGFPGSGKSTFVSQLVKKLEEVSAVHYCVFGNEERILPHRVIMSLAYHLATQIPAYRHLIEIQLIENPDIINMSYIRLFEHLFTIPLFKMGNPNQDIIIIIDALDEAKYNDKNEILDLVSNEFHKTPSWLRFLITSRPDVDIIRRVKKSQSIYLDEKNEHHVQDMKQYIRHLSTKLSHMSLSDQLINQLIERSNNNYIFVREIMRYFEQEGAISDTLPIDISQVYLLYFERIFSRQSRFTYKEDIRPLLEIFYASYDPIDISIYSSILNKDEYTIEEMIEALDIFFILSENKMIAQHKTISDWFLNRQMSGKYYVNIKSGHVKLFDFFSKSIRNPLYHDYIIKHYIKHAIEGNQIENAIDLINNHEFFQNRMKSLGTIHALRLYFNDVILLKNHQINLHQFVFNQENFHKIILEYRDIFLDSYLINSLDEFDFGEYVKSKLNENNIYMRIVNLSYLRFKGNYEQTYHYAIESIKQFENINDPISLSKLYQFAALGTYYYADYEKTKIYLMNAMSCLENLQSERLNYLTLTSFYADNLMNNYQIDESITLLEKNVLELHKFLIDNSDYQSQKDASIQLMDAQRCLILTYTLENDLKIAQYYLNQILSLPLPMITYYEDYNKFKIVEMFFYYMNGEWDKAESLKHTISLLLTSDYHFGLMCLYQALSYKHYNLDDLVIIDIIEKGIEVASKRKNRNVLEQLYILKAVILHQDIDYTIADIYQYNNHQYYDWLYQCFFNLTKRES